MLHQLMNSLDSLILDAISSLGIWGIFFGMLVESACIPLPSEVIMLFGGFLVGNGQLSFWSVIFAGVFGNLIGSILIYWVGKKGGRPFIEKYGKYVLLNQNHVKKSEAWFDKYGSAATFFGRILPVIRTFISLPAGMANMKMSKFITFTFLGCIPWNMVLVYMGVKLGENWETAQSYMKPVTYLIFGAVILLGLWWVFKLIKSRKAARQE
ncbi:DedA family protein [Falsibacillus albus]|uniref:DedA family protein n=1 Tax=Falsibacillus albus TaxID=2478915 RepID=A0A3L7JLX7_9BACI|nr:DedA family protein [Falsibacillus albus]RLQ91089.1 DedA family protein [Falsibacillus albus]